ncbi:MAG: glycerate kinase type-2 family protein [Candidatus Saccharicenans sp.]|uniref:glycerate kinase type-2 family protein n=1 Tax=Candidatus Saccharicenans sp. TaxID=2819258 RepID=UPI00404A2140
MDRFSGRKIELKEIARSLSQAALSSVKPGRLVEESVRRAGNILTVGGQKFNLSDFEKINLISFGKAGVSLAEALLPLIEDQLDSAVITGSQTYRQEGRLFYFPAAHPLPDDWSLKAGQKACELALSLTEKDLLLVLISGGGSAHLCLPEEGVSLEDKRQLTWLLLKAGADIKELNTVRKHLSRIKGGRLARAAWPARVVNLIVSDVIGNDLESIASGPTWHDSTTFAQAGAVLEKYSLWSVCSESIRRVLKEGQAGLREETVRKGDRVLERVSSVIIGDNLKALYAAKEAARQFGLETIILTSEDRGEAREAARNYLGQLQEFCRKVREQKRSFCLLAGGELTVTVKGQGQGGRNTEFVLASLVEILDRKQDFEDFDWLVMSLATDGRDGPTDSAGAWIGPESLERVKRLSLSPQSYLENNDSYHFFEEAGGLLKTGPTGTNVMDLRLFLLAPFPE